MGGEWVGDDRQGVEVINPYDDSVVGIVPEATFDDVDRAIAAGNAIVLKPATKTPLSSIKLASILADAGLPADALNIVIGSGKAEGSRLVEDERLAMITFTGSPSVGVEIKAKCGLKRVTL